MRACARALLASAGAAGLVACGGGGDAGRPVLGASATAQQCSVGNPYRSDATGPTTLGSLTTEKLWLRAYLGDAYLWYDEIPAVDATAPAYSVDTTSGFYASIDNYFEALKTPRLTASGRRKDEFSFTYPTRQWQQLSQSGVALGYGIEWIFTSPTPPRNIRIAYIEPGSPAAAAGLLRGDSLQFADGVSSEDGTSQGVDILNAAIFPNVVGNHSFVLSRNGTTLPTQTFAASNITKQPVLLTQVITVGASQVGYIVFNDHLATAESQLIAAIGSLKAAGVTDLVLDLRYNGGGFLYVASELAYMIAGPTRTAGKVFERLRYNDKRGADTDRAAANAGFRSVSLASDPLPTLDLGRVYVLAGNSTCSASESIINGLRGVGVSVIEVGGTTCGKPYGFYPQDNCGTTYFSIEFAGVNAAGFGEYSDGFSPANTATKPGVALPGCSVGDDFSRDLGDSSEGRLAAALNYLADQTCPAAAAASSAGGVGAPPLVNEAVTPKSPFRENRILRR